MFLALTYIIKHKEVEEKCDTIYEMLQNSSDTVLVPIFGFISS